MPLEEDALAFSFRRAPLSEYLLHETRQSCRDFCLPMRMATESVTLCVRIKSSLRLWNSNRWCAEPMSAYQARAYMRIRPSLTRRVCTVPARNRF